MNESNDFIIVEMGMGIGLAGDARALPSAYGLWQYLVHLVFSFDFLLKTATLPLPCNRRFFRFTPAIPAES